MRHSHAHSRRARSTCATLGGGFAAHAADEPLNIRPWRHVELPSLIRLYQDRLPRVTAPSNATKRMAVARESQAGQRQTTDGILCRDRGPKRFDFDFDDAAIVGYCVQQDDKIWSLSLAETSRHGRTTAARACGPKRSSAIIRRAAPLVADRRQLKRRRAAGGTLNRSEQHKREVTMVKLLDRSAS